MVGRLWLGCGSAEEERPLWLSMLSGRPGIRILYWPFALPSTMRPGAEQWLRANLDALGLRYELQTWHDLDEHTPSDLTIEGVDLLWVGGGNTFRLLDAIQRNAFINPVRQFWRNGGDYYGGSAGAVVACETIEIAKGHDPNDVDLTDLGSMGLITGMEILPHFTPDQSINASRRVRERGGAVIGLPESIGIVRAGEDATVLGSGHLSIFNEHGVAEVIPGASFRMPNEHTDCV